MTRFLRLGALAGAAGGLAFALFLFLVGEGPIRDAIEIEEAHATGAHEELFSRSVQVIGGMLGAVVYGILLGAIFGVVFAAIRHRLRGRDDWFRAVGLAAASFVTINLVPFLKYPGNPPAVGDPDTVGQRTGLYVSMLVCSTVITWGAWRLDRTLRAKAWPTPTRVPMTLAAYAATLALVLVLLPGAPDPVNAPATVVWRFRMASLGGSLILWSVTGLVFGWLAWRTEAAARIDVQPSPLTEEVAGRD
jgi:predicted cobalt transporter CbtA